MYHFKMFLMPASHRPYSSITNKSKLKNWSINYFSELEVSDQEFIAVGLDRNKNHPYLQDPLGFVHKDLVLNYSYKSLHLLLDPK